MNPTKLSEKRMYKKKKSGSESLGCNEISHMDVINFGEKKKDKHTAAKISLKSPIKTYMKMEKNSEKSIKRKRVNVEDEMQKTAEVENEDTVPVEKRRKRELNEVHDTETPIKNTVKKEQPRIQKLNRKTIKELTCKIVKMWSQENCYNVAKDLETRHRESIGNTKSWVDFVGPTGNPSLGKPIRELLVEWKHKLQVRGLTDDITVKDLKSRFPNSNYILIIPEDNGCALAYILYKTEELVDADFKESENMLINGKRVDVAYFLPYKIMQCLTLDAPKRQEKQERQTTRQLLTGRDLEAQLQRKEKYQRKLVYIKNILRNVAEEDIKALSDDILQVDFKKIVGHILHFETEDIAEKNYKNFLKMEDSGHKLKLKYVNAKSRTTNQLPTEMKINKTKLVVTGLHAGITKECLFSEFPGAEMIEMYPRRCGAVIKFANEISAETAFKNSENRLIDGKAVEVFYATYSSKRLMYFDFS